MTSLNASALELLGLPWIIGEWVTCPVCRRRYIYEYDTSLMQAVRKVGECSCKPAMVLTEARNIYDDGFVSVLLERPL